MRVVSCGGLKPPKDAIFEKAEWPAATHLGFELACCSLELDIFSLGFRPRCDILGPRVSRLPQAHLASCTTSRRNSSDEHSAW